MKKASLTFIVLIFFSGLSAQYKKASFFDKEGRTYGLSAEAHFLGDGKKTVPGFALTFGRDRAGKHLFSTTDIRFLPAFKFSYETRDMNGNALTVSGKSKMHLIYGMNWGYFILKNEEEQTFKPYVTAGFNVVVLGGVKQFDNDQDYSYDVEKITPMHQFSTGIGGGVGAIFNLSSVLGIKLEGGYTYQLNLSTESAYDNVDTYYMYTPHPYASLGLRFRVVSE
jgi:hypothetical protein